MQLLFQAGRAGFEPADGTFIVTAHGVPGNVHARRLNAVCYAAFNLDTLLLRYLGEVREPGA